MAFRDETDALRSQRDALEKERDDLKNRLDVLTSSPFERERLDIDTRLRAAEGEIHRISRGFADLGGRFRVLAFGAVIVVAFLCFAVFALGLALLHDVAN